MSKFDPEAHPRGQATNAGQFAGKDNSAPEAPIEETDSQRIQAKDLLADDMLQFENFQRGKWKTVRNKVTEVEILVRLSDYRRYVVVHCEGLPPMEYAYRAPVVIDRRK